MRHPIYPLLAWAFLTGWLVCAGSWSLRGQQGTAKKPVGLPTVTPPPTAAPAPGSGPAVAAPVPASAAQVTVQEEEPAGARPVAPAAPGPGADDENQKTGDAFAAQCWLVANKQFFDAWNRRLNPPVNPVRSVARDQSVHTAIFFARPTSDAQGRTQVSYDVTVRRPDGSVYGEHREVLGWRGAAAPPELPWQLGRDYVSIHVDGDDPLGVYSVEVNVKDQLAGTVLPLKTRFRVTP